MTRIIKTAEHCGFCFGVRRAVDMLEAELAKGTRIYMLGKLIHNDAFIRGVQSRGVRIISEDDVRANKIEAGASVIIRAHGAARELLEELRGLGVNIIDATCECVKRMHEIVREHTGPDTRTIIFGDAGHPEIVALDSYISGGREIYADFGEFINNCKNNGKISIILAQTTHNIEDWQKVRDFFGAGGGGATVGPARLFDTICGATDKRQREAARLASECDVMLVIGSGGSANTRRLFEICKQNCAESYIIETYKQLPRILSRGRRAVKVGITAGASTPDGIIKEVKTFMAESNVTSNTNGGVPENGQGLEQSFEEMLNESFVTLNRGERVKGVVSHISGSEIYVDLGGKYTGVLAFDEVTDDSSADLKDLFKVGDEIETQIIKTNDQEGTALLSRKRIDATDNWEKIIRHLEEGTTADGKVVQAVNGGIIALVESVKVFVPASHANVSKDTDLQTLVNKQVRVKIIDVNQQKHRAIASIRNAENEQRRALEAKIWEEIEIGKKYEGVVKSIANYGAFVDIGGVDGMVHKTELSWTRIKHPSEVLKNGDRIQVYIKDFDTERRRILLGYKDEADNPWNKFVLAYNVGDIAEVRITSMMPFGAFAEVIPGVDGLIHISEITDKRISKPNEVLNIGDMVRAKITKIDTGEKKQVGLSILAAEEADEKLIAEEFAVEAADAEAAPDPEQSEPEAIEPELSTPEPEGANE